MKFKERLKKLRQEKGWSQAQLGQKLNVHQKQISGYERGVHVPSTDLMVKIAEAFNVSLDYLAFDNKEDNQKAIVLADRDLIEKLAQIQQLPDKDKVIVKAVLDAFIKKRRFEELAVS